MNIMFLCWNQVLEKWLQECRVWAHALNNCMCSVHVDMPQAGDAVACLRVSTWTALLPQIRVVQLIQILFVHFNMD